ncbi:MAG TPA: RNA polymerase sigma factor [Longimicrobiales bacterium]
MSEENPVPAPIDWSQLYAETFDDLARYLHRKVWDSERAHDLAQEVFVRALEHGRTTTPERPRAWLFTIAANLARDESKMVLRRRKHLSLIQGGAATSSEPDPIERMERESKEAAARRALEELSERDREVLLLWDAGFNYQEIAEQAGLAVGAIGTTLARARRRLVEAHEALEAKNAAH